MSLPISMSSFRSRKESGVTNDCRVILSITTNFQFAFESWISNFKNQLTNNKGWTKLHRTTDDSAEGGLTQFCDFLIMISNAYSVENDVVLASN